jgi:hypothetical protein
MTDVEALIETLRTRFPSLPPQETEGWGGNPALNVLDCVLSLNRRYDSVVLPRVTRFAEKHTGVDTLQALQDLMGSYPSPFEFSAAELDYEDSRRADTLRGVISYLLDVEQNFPGSSELQRLRAWANWARPGDYAFTGVRGFGLAGFQYLRLLLGANTAKPDVWICRFVSESIARPVGPAEALFLLERAARRANLHLRDIDAAIWSQSARGAVAAPPNDGMHPAAQNPGDG